MKIAALPSVKLRLGRIIHGQQKGVDSMITRDLMTLARERAIPTAYLLAGDEDLREAVAAAQDLGVQVILLGVAPVEGATNQSFTLVNECDANIVFDQNFCAPFFSPKNASLVQEPEPLLEPILEIQDEKSEEQAAHQLGTVFCNTWFEHEGAANARLLEPSLPELPRDVDSPLLRHAESIFGSLRHREDLRKFVRQAFVARLKELLTNKVLDVK